jgi:hypothetical protein
MAVNIGAVEAILQVRDAMSPAVISAAEKVLLLKKEIEALGTAAGPAFNKLNAELYTTTDRLEKLTGLMLQTPDKYTKAAQATDNMTKSTAESTKKLTEQSEAVQKNADYLGQFERLVIRMAERMAVLWVVRGAYEFAESTIKNAEALVRLSEQTDLSIGKLQTLQFAANATEVPFNTVTAAVNHLDKALGESKSSTVDALQNINLSVGQLLGMNPDERFSAVATALSRVTDKTELASLAVKLFGTDAVIPLIQNYAQLEIQAKQTHSVMSDEGIHILADTGRAFKGLGTDIYNAGRDMIEFLAILSQPMKSDGAGYFIQSLLRGTGYGVSSQGLIGNLPGALLGALAVGESTYKNPPAPRFVGPYATGQQGGVSLTGPYETGYQGGNIESNTNTMRGWDFIIKQSSNDLSTLNGEQWAFLETLRAMNILTADNAGKMDIGSTAFRQYMDLVKEWNKDTTKAAADQQKDLDATQASIARTAILWDDYYANIDKASGNEHQARLDAIDTWEDRELKVLNNSIDHNKNYWNEWEAIYNAANQRRTASEVAYSELVINRTRAMEVSNQQAIDKQFAGMSMLAALRQHMIDLGIDPGLNSDGTLPGLTTEQGGTGTMTGTRANPQLAIEQRLQRALGALDFGATIERAFVSGGISQALESIGAKLSQKIATSMNKYLSDRSQINGGDNYDGHVATLAGAQGAISGLEIASGGGTAGHQFAQMGMSAAGTGVSAGIAAGSIGAGIAVGATTMGIGAAVIGAIYWYRATHPPEWQQLGEALGHDLGVNISEELAKSISDNAHNLRTPIRAQVLRQFGSVIEAAGGIDESNVEAFTARLDEVFHFVHDGALTAAEGVRILNQNFQALVADNTDDLGRISDGLRRIINDAEDAGMSSQAIKDWQKGQTSGAASGINALLLSGATTPADLADMSGMAQTGVAAQMATGSSFAQAISSESDGLNKLQEDYVKLNLERAKHDPTAFGARATELANQIIAAQALIDSGTLSGSKLDDTKKKAEDLKLEFEGLTEDAGTRTMFIENKLVQTQGILLRGLDGLTSATINFDNLGIETADMFEAQERQGYGMYVRLQSAVHELGGDTREALLPMQGWLHTAADEAERLGVPLDANTQMMINQSKELGIWHDKGKSAAEITERLASAVEALVNWLNGIPPNVNSHIDVTTTHHDDSGEPAGTPQPPDIPGGGHTPPLSPDHPDDHNGPGAPSEPHYPPGQGPDDPGPPPGVYHGGPVRYLGRGGPVSWRPQGPDTVAAMLDPREGVVTAAGMDRIGEGGLRSINQGTISRSANVGSMTIIIQADGRQMAEIVTPYLPGVRRRYRLN